MKAHVRDKLFDYLSGEIPGEEAGALEAHLAHCDACREDLRMIREAIDILQRKGTLPSDERGEHFWNAFPARVEERIDARGKSRAPLIAYAADRILSAIQMNRAHLLAGSGALALIALAVLLLRPSPAKETAPAAAETSAPAITLEPAGVKLHDYLKKSRVLLVGVTNLRTGGDTPIDLSIERRESRELIHQGRILKGEALDARSARLVSDLEKILIELANGDEQHDAPDMEIIRSGIRDNNLLFKVRMTESALAAATYERNTQ